MVYLCLLSFLQDGTTLTTASLSFAVVRRNRSTAFGLTRGPHPARGLPLGPLPISESQFRFRLYRIFREREVIPFDFFESLSDSLLQTREFFSCSPIRLGEKSSHWTEDLFFRIETFPNRKR